MRFTKSNGLLIVSALLVCVVLLRTGRTQASSPARHAVVVELFTSEGCSSCPPADQLLSRLGREQRQDGVEIIPLGLHVDYWNFQGWTDRFSSNEYSQRQFSYAERFRLQSPYTPQLVFDGSAESDGDDAARAQVLIDRAAQRPAAAEVHLSMAAGDKVDINVKTSQNPGSDVFLAVTEDNLASKIGAGENNGRQLRHSAVVRELRLLGPVRDGSYQATVPIKIKKDWKRKDLRAVVFVQEHRYGAIDGAASLSLENEGASAAK